MDELKVAVIGCGGLGKREAQIAHEAPGVRLVAVSDANEQVAQAKGSYTGQYLNKVLGGPRGAGRDHGELTRSGSSANGSKCFAFSVKSSRAPPFRAHAAMMAS